MKFDELNHIAQLVVCEALSMDDWDKIMGKGKDEIQLLINGKEVDFNKFASYLEQSFDQQVTKEAEQLALQSRVSKLDAYRELDSRIWSLLESLRFAESNLLTAQDILRKGIVQGGE